MTYAVADDVAARWRPLTDAEELVVQTWLSDAEIRLKFEIPDLEQRLDDGRLDQDAVIFVLANAVIRLAQNPEGAKRLDVSIDDARKSVEMYGRRGEGEIFFTDDDLALLRGSRRKRRRSAAYTVDSMPS